MPVLVGDGQKWGRQQRVCQDNATDDGGRSGGDSKDCCYLEAMKRH